MENKKQTISLIPTENIGQSLAMPEFPVADDFVVSWDENENPVSYFIDMKWNFGATSFNFQNYPLSQKNLTQLKELLLCFIFHMPLFPGTYKSTSRHFNIFTKLAVYCDSQKIELHKLYRFTSLCADFMLLFSPQQQKHLVSYYKALYREEDETRLQVCDITFIDKIEELKSTYTSLQNAYIPSRIWNVLQDRCDELLDDFTTHKKQLFSSFSWISNAYKHNAAFTYKAKSPFQDADKIKKPFNYHGQGLRPLRIIHVGGAKDYFKKAGLDALLSKWIKEPDDKWGLVALSSFLTLVRNVCLIYINMHSIQRIGETLSLRSDCLTIDKIPFTGDVSLICGETTKTIDDDDARWVIPRFAEKAIHIAAAIAEIRINEFPDSLSEDQIRNPYLATSALEPWASTKATVIKDWDFKDFLVRYPNFLPSESILLTSDDYKVALQGTPMITKNSWFEIGKPWSFNAHQLRRTLAVNMRIFGVSIYDIQWVLKHNLSSQTYHYTRNHSQLGLNKNATEFIKGTFYELDIALARKVNNTPKEQISSVREILFPVSDFDFISEKKQKELLRLARKGKLHARPTLIGLCMAKECEYGGCDSVIHCIGEKSNSPCIDAIFVKERQGVVKELKKSRENLLKKYPKGSLAYKAVKSEIKSMENFLHAAS